MDVPEVINWILDQDGELLSATAVESLYWLVRRSNQTPEPWMRWIGWPCSEPGETARWREWWQAHRADFKLVRSLAEAAKDHEREHPARIADPPRQKAPRRFGWTLAAIFGVVVVLWGVRRGWRAFKKSSQRSRSAAPS
jgi:predicted alpha-1,6-mannanase (GH76 family)